MAWAEGGWSCEDAGRAGRRLREAVGYNENIKGNLQKIE